MSMQQPHGENGRPLTRRELRELSERQAQNSTPVEAPSTPSPLREASVPTSPQPFGSPTNSAFTAAGPATNSVPFGSTTPVAQQSNPVPNASLPQRNSVSQFTPQSGFGSPLSAASGVNPRQNAAQIARFEQAPSPSSPTLQARPVTAPDREPVQLTRRSMYQAPTSPPVPQVTPPAQAGAVRMLEETGTISRLVDPAQFDPASTTVTPNAVNAAQSPFVRTNSSVVNGSTNPDTSVQNGRSNLSEFMRQAPPSSQIPRVIQDNRGNWTAAEPASVQQQFEANGAMLPSWGQSSTPFDSQSLVGAQPSFVPEQGKASNPLPSRVSSHQSEASSQAQNRGLGLDGFVPNEAAPLSATFTPFGQTAPAVGSTPVVPAATAQRSLDIVDEPTAPFQMPDWDAITSIDSALPQDPTRGGVSITQLTGEFEPVSTPIGAASSTPLGTGFSGSTTPAAFPTSAGFPAPAAFPTPATEPGFQTGVATPDSQKASLTQGALTARPEDDDEEFELDHSYTWLHYLILVAVAFVLGVVIWMVGINPDRDNAPVDEPAALANSIAIDAGGRKLL